MYEYFVLQLWENRFISLNIRDDDSMPWRPKDYDEYRRGCLNIWISIWHINAWIFRSSALRESIYLTQYQRWRQYALTAKRLWWVQKGMLKYMNKYMTYKCMNISFFSFERIDLSHTISETTTVCLDGQVIMINTEGDVWVSDTRRSLKTLTCIRLSLFLPTTGNASSFAG